MIKRTSITSEDCPLTPEQIEEFFSITGDFFSGKNDQNDEEKLRKLFNIYDRNGDGRISAREMRVIMGTVYPEDIAEYEIKKMIENADKNHDSKIDIEEFIEMMKNYKNMNKIQSL